MESDAELVARTVGGDREAFAVLMGRYERLARATAFRVVIDRHLVEDVVQEGFMAAYKSLPNLRVESKFGPWLLGIVRRQAVRSVRRKRETVPLHESTENTTLANGNDTLPDESMTLLELIDRLSDGERSLIGLRHFQGHSMQEIATITSRPVGTVTKQLSRIHKKLKQWCSEEKCNE